MAGIPMVRILADDVTAGWKWINTLDYDPERHTTVEDAAAVSRADGPGRQEEAPAPGGAGEASAETSGAPNGDPESVPVILRKSGTWYSYVHADTGERIGKAMRDRDELIGSLPPEHVIVQEDEEG